MKDYASTINIRTFFFYLFILLECVDLASDWLFYNDIRRVEKGLVFGPHEQSLVSAVLAFAIIGSIFFIPALTATYYDWLRMYDGNEDKNSDRNWLGWINLVILWIEDIPQAFILLVVSLCREDPSSVYQLVKVSLILTIDVIKLIAFFLTTCGLKCDKVIRCNNVKFFVFLGVVIELLLAAMVFFALQVRISEGGDFHFIKPTSILGDKHDNRYFSDVSIFIRDPNIRPFEEDRAAWLRLDSISNIKQLGDYSIKSIRLEYQTTANNDATILRVLERRARSKWNSVGCYNISRGGHTHVLESADCSILNPSNLGITFRFKKPSHPDYVMGDIKFNAGYTKSGKTVRLSSSMFTESTASFDASRKVNGMTLKGPISMHYFRHKPITQNANNTPVVADSKGGGFRLYRFQIGEMIDVTEIWKTGWLKCDTTGNLGPSWGY